MSIETFELPNEIKNETYEKILSSMLSRVSDEYDKTEGSFVFDMLSPAALEAAELVQYWLALALRTNYHMFAEGKWLDYHASDCGLKRRAATRAYGDVTVTTAKSVTFPAGFVFSVPSEDGSVALDFETLEEATIDGTGKIRVRAMLAGVTGNVAAGAITIMRNPLTNVTAITNEEALSGGTLAESDESLRMRTDDFYGGRGSSYVGNKKDYERWAKSVDGVGFAHCIPTYEGANTVAIVLADATGKPANAEICAAAERYIFGTGHDDPERLAPIGIVKYKVKPFETTPVNISLEAEISTNESAVISEMKAALQEYIKELADTELNYGTLKYIEVSRVLTGVPGLEDFRHLRLNGKIENLSFDEEKIPYINRIEFV